MEEYELQLNLKDNDCKPEYGFCRLVRLTLWLTEYVCRIETHLP